MSEKLTESDRGAIVRNATHELLVSGTEDWVDLVTVQSEVVAAGRQLGKEFWYGSGNRRPSKGLDEHFDIRYQLGMEVVNSVLSAGYMVPGEVFQGFSQWSGSPEEWIPRIASDWRRMGASLSLNDICWFALTDAGHIFLSASLTSPSPRDYPVNPPPGYEGEWPPGWWVQHDQ